MFGNLKMSFNGETTEAISVGELGRMIIENRVNNTGAIQAAMFVKSKLEALTVISTVGVTAQATRDLTTSSISLTFDVEFHYGELVTTPLNLGDMPPLGLDVSGITGLISSGLQVVQ